MSKPIDYRALFDDETAGSFHALRRELETLLSPHPAPSGYRESLRAQLLRAASDESFYARGFSYRLIFAMVIVSAVLLTVVAYIAWRSQAARPRPTPA
jgi:hypothetical protein